MSSKFFLNTCGLRHHVEMPAACDLGQNLSLVPFCLHLIRADDFDADVRAAVSKTGMIGNGT